jgi:hypothetical protein
MKRKKEYHIHKDTENSGENVKLKLWSHTKIIILLVCSYTKFCSEGLTPEILVLVLFPDVDQATFYEETSAAWAGSRSSKERSVYLKKKKHELGLIKLYKPANCQ